MYRSTIVLIILTIGCISQVYTAEDAEKDALEFIQKAPTFSFDGIRKTLQITAIEPSGCDGCFTVTVKFTCRSAGYGNRTSLFLVSRPTEHMALIHIQRGTITQALIDNQWDELNQKSVT
ncbi:MAG: hypothetical protein HXS53_08640 [Theionarchaea archaeon]|nr:hypothetical protein [Theionarchaea archaeon]